MSYKINFDSVLRSECPSSGGFRSSEQLSSTKRPRARKIGRHAKFRAIGRLRIYAQMSFDFVG